MARRSAGEGTITRHKNGLWQGKVSLGFDKDGKRIRRSVYGKTQDEVRRKIFDLRKKFRSGVSDRRMTVAEYLESWMRDDVRPNVAPRTAETYRSVLDTHIVPHLGKKQLANVGLQECRQWMQAMQKDGASNFRRGRAMQVFRIALNAAVRNELIPDNPVCKLVKPKHKKRKAEVLSLEQCRKLIDVSRPHRIGDIVILALFSGLRLGELFGLHWSDIDFENKCLHVRRGIGLVRGMIVVGGPKTETSERKVLLESVALQCLQERREKAIAEGFGPECCEVVFANRKGSYLRNTNFYECVWKKMRDEAELPVSFRFHDLRHTHATLFFAVGGSMKELQDRLGHSTIGVTMDTYTKIFEDTRRGSVDALSRLGLSYRSDTDSAGESSDSGRE